MVHEGGMKLENQQFSIPLSHVVAEFHLEKVYESTDFEKVEVTSSEVNRPGMQIVGFFDYFDSRRIQIFGKVETSYLREFTHEQKDKCFDKLVSTQMPETNKIPMIVITRSLEVFPELLEAAKKYDVSIFRCSESTSSFMSALISYLNLHLAPRMTRHGVLVEVHGEGVLILGESGVGKSETAVELVKRGHRFVADDAVELKRVSDKTLIGTAPDIIRHFIEIRGIGIVDIRRLFGMGAVKDTEKVDMIIHLEPWDETKQYDRLGLVDEYTNLLGVNIPSVTIPVRPGRNLAIIVEVAAMNNRQKRMGYNAAEELNSRLMSELEKSSD